MRIDFIQYELEDKEREVVVKLLNKSRTPGFCPMIRKCADGIWAAAYWCYDDLFEDDIEEQELIDYLNSLVVER